MENNLDKYFRDNLHDRRFEMKEEYWLGAEKLLDAQDERRRRRLLFWWSGGGLGILLLIGLAWLVLAKEGPEKPAVPATSVASENYLQNGENQPTLQAVKEEHVSQQQKASSAQEADAPKAHPAKNAAQAGQSDQKPTKNRSTLKTIINQSVANSRTRSPLFPMQAKEAEPSPLVQKNQVGTHQNASEGPANTLAESSTPKVNDQARPTAADQPRETASLSALGGLTCFVSGDFDQQPLGTTVAKTSSIIPSKRRELHAGLMLSQIFQPHPSDGENWRLGNQLGLTLRYDLNHDFYLASGLQYQRRTGHFEATKLAEQRSYRFGLELDTLVLRPSSLHYLTIPVLVGWEKNRHSLELGLQFDFLTGISGETGSYRKVGEPPVKAFVGDKKGWMPKDGYHRYIANLQMGYNYRIGRLWTLGIAANYSLNGIIDPGFEPPVGGFLLRESDKFNLNFKASYFFN